jgi:RHS repeat-associated protein
MLTVLRKSFYALLLFFSASAAMAQVATGTYNYGTFDNLGLDTINVGNLNIHFSIPVLNKAGRGLPFYYNLSFDSSVWYPVTVGGTEAWVLVQGNGWRADTEIATGYVSYSQIVATRGACTTVNNINFVYHDTFGVSHPFVGDENETIPSGAGTCTILQPPNALTATAKDGSGYTLNVVGMSEATLTSASGKQISPPVLYGIGSANATDSNGNQISVNGSGQFTDTTGNVVLSVAGSAPSPHTFTYKDTSGNPQAVTMTYETKTVQTAFGCSGIGEYGPTSTSLVHTISFPDGSTYTFSYEPTPGVPANVTGRVASIELPQGGLISYSYTGGSHGIECADGSTSGLTRTLAASQSSAASTWTYTRTTGTGTSQTAVVDGLSNHKTYNFVEASNQTAPTTAVYYETSRSINQGTSVQVLARSTCYNYTGSSSPCTSTAFSLPIAQIDTYETLDGVATHGATAKYNTYGAQTEADIYDFGTTARGALLRQEDWGYSYSIIPVLPTSDTVFDGSGNEFGSTLFGYDGGTPTASSGVPQHVAVSGPRGNLTSEVITTSSSGFIALSNTYEDTGSILTSVTPNGTTTYHYDTTFVYNTSVSSPTPSSGVTIGTGASYDTAFTGLPSGSSDPNGQTATIPSYDSMLRPTAIQYPDGGATSFAYSPTQTGTYISQTTSTATNTQVQYDGYGRQSRVAVFNGQSGDQWYQNDICYDGNGNLQYSSYAYLGAGFAGTTKVCSGSGVDTYTYDVLGRLKTLTRGDGEARSYTYTGRATKFVDENSVTRISQIDGLGRPTIVCEISSTTTMPPSGSPGPVSCGTDITATGFTTTYSYALATGTTTVSQGLATQGGQTRTFQTDWLGRTTSVTEPESGTTTYSYAYNTTGLVVTRMRPKANQSIATVLTTTTTQYDTLGRVISIVYNDGTGTRNFAYDTPTGWPLTQTNLKGRLAAAAMSTPGITYGVATLFSYDSMGRVAGMGECTPAACGTTADARYLSYTYDLAGNMKTSTDGGGVTSTYTVSQANELQSLTSSASNTTNPANLISNVQNGPNGPTSFSLGNGLTGVNGYDGLGRLFGAWVCNGSNAITCTGGTQIHGEAVGLWGTRATSECDTLIGCMNYGYDEFNRLTSRTVTSGTVQNYAYSYDRYGNRWSQTLTLGGGTGSQTSYNFITSGFHTNNQITTAGFTYDAAGNMTNDGFHTYTYDGEGNITAVDSGSTATYVYNALNQRVRAVTSSGALEFVFNAAGQRVSTWNGSTQAQIQGQYYWGSKPVAFYKSSATHFQHQDWLGTERLRSTYNGTVEGTFASLPFGDAQTTTSCTDLDQDHYAQLDYDSETNTDHAQFRQYNNTQGRWMRPDPYSGSYDFSNTQSMNRYAYVLNNPLSLVDPFGMAECQPGVESTGECDITVNEGCNDDPMACGWTPQPGSYYCMTVGIHCFTGGGGGGGGGGAAPNNTPQKSPARQQCEQQAAQQFQAAVQAENATIPSNLKTAAGEGFVGGLVGGCIAGAVATSPLGPGAGAGCVAAAVPAALWGAVIGPTISFGHSVFSELGMMSAYNNQVNNVCSKL